MPKRILQGVVVSDKADKTAVVRVERRIMHPLYKKYITRSKRFAAHDADNRCRIGDKVRIQECPPISKSKAYTVIYDDTTGPARSEPKADVRTETKTEVKAEKKAEKKAEAKVEAKTATKPKTAKGKTAGATKKAAKSAKKAAKKAKKAAKSAK